MIQLSADELAKRYYDKPTYEHAVRVAHYVMESPFLKRLDKKDEEWVWDIALLHDILEDTKCPKEFLGQYKMAVEILTHAKEKETYEDYLALIRDNAAISIFNDNIDEMCFLAYIVKLADIKDHLSQKETLTDKLKEKYLSGLAMLL